jgi:hypothetical protein
MSYEDILAGTQPIVGMNPDVATSTGANAPAPDSWLSDLGSAVKSIASAAFPVVGTYYQNQAVIKNQMAVAASRSGPPPGLNYPGLGYSTQQLVPYGAVQPANYLYAGPQGLQIGPGDMGPPMNAPAPGGGSMSMPSLPIQGAGGSAFHTTGQPVARADRLIIQANPLNGKLHVWYHVGGLDRIIREGLRACGYGHKRRHRRRRF